MQLELKKIRTDGRTQPREILNEDVIAEYAEAMGRGDKFPMVDVFYDGTNYWLADGFHRVGAARRANLKKIEAKIHRGTLRDAILFSCGVNAQHGQRRTNTDKRRAVLKLLNDDKWNRWSDREIAKRCAVSHVFVGAIRGELSVNDYQIAERKATHSETTHEKMAGSTRHVSRGGKTYEMRTDKIGGGQKKEVDGNGGDNKIPPGPRVPAGRIGTASATNQIDARIDRPQRRFQDISLALATLHGACEAFIARDFSGTDFKQLKEVVDGITRLIRQLVQLRKTLHTMVIAKGDKHGKA